MTRRSLRRAVALGAAAVLVPTGLGAAPAAGSTRGSAQDVAQAVRLDRVVGHLEALQDIADRNGGTRASGTRPG